MNNTLEKRNKTLQFYEAYASDYAKSTVSVDMSPNRNHFMERLQKSAYILDFGCGSGRDTKVFLDHGYRVDAADGCEKLCQIASDYTGIKVKHMMFHELSVDNQYDGIWACASLLHLPYTKLKDVLVKLKAALKDNGILYMSFKYGKEEKVINGKHYTYMDKAKLETMIHDIKGIAIDDIWYSQDLMPGRESETWTNIIVKKEPAEAEAKS